MSSRSSIRPVATTLVLGARLMHHTPNRVASKDQVKVHTSWVYASIRSNIFESNAYSCKVNRNKKSLGLSFQHKAGVDILHKLAKDCDVLVENYLPGALKKYGMDYDSVAKINPGLIYASITGYGQTGPYSSRAGYDVMVEA